MMDDIVWIEPGNGLDHALVGGKAANLSHLAAGHRVPPAFCLPTTAFARWLPSGAHTVSALPAELYAQLAAAYQQLAARCGSPELRVAVRSSAVDEDGACYSYAGQHTTYLNVVGLAPVAQAVLACWASARSAHALAYRQQHGLATDNIHMAVIVQQLIPADVSAILFSANPVTSCPTEIVINASWGLGESLVNGAVTPDMLVIRKDDLAVLSYQLGHKGTMTVPAPVGTHQLPTPRWLRTQPALTPAQILELAQLALTLETHMGWPVDVECCYRHGVLYLLQCRPITHPTA